MQEIIKKYLTFSSIAITLILIVVSCLLWLANSHLKEEEKNSTPAREKMTKLPDFEIDKVKKIRVLFAHTDPVELKIVDGSWVVSQKGKPEMYANVKMVKELLTQLSETRLLREYELNFGREDDRKDIWSIALGDYNDQRKLSAGDIYTGFQVQLFDESGDIFLDVMLGQVHFAEAESLNQSQQMQHPDGRYLRLSGNSPREHRYFLVPHLFEMLQKGNESAPWAERLRMNSLNAQDFQNQVREMEFRNKEEGSVWKFMQWGKGHILFQGKKQVEKIQAAYLHQKLQLLQGGFSRDIAPAGFDFMPTHFIHIKLNNGVLYKLEMQNSRFEDLRLAKLTIEFNKEYVIHLADESEQAREARITRQEQLVNIEKKWFEGKIFVLQPDVIRILENVPGT